MIGSAYEGALHLETDLADGVATVEAERGGRGLTYPLGDAPDLGQAVQAAPGVLWLRLPLPMALNHVNVYAIADSDGWVIVDTGLQTPDCRDGFEMAFAGALEGRPVTRVICTHMHPDHIGLAGWICDRFKAPLLMSRLEYTTGRMLIADTGPAPEDGVVMYRAAGWDEVRLDRWRQTYGQFAMGAGRLPDSFTRLSDGDILRIGNDDWSIVVGDGHSPEHVCLWRKSDGVFISGDQILPRISSNISIWPTEPMADPLADWMGSLERLKVQLPSDLLVLPGHGDPFVGVTARLEALIRGHEVSLTRLERSLQTPKRAVDVFGSLFARPVGPGLFAMATGESLAHLNYLENQGRAWRSRNADGVDWWTSTEPQE